MHGPLSVREHETYGIQYLKKQFNLAIAEIGPLVESSHYNFKRNFKFPLISTFKDLEKFLSTKKEAMCWETGFSYNSLKVASILKKYKIRTISADGISSLPTRRFLKETRHFEIFLRRVKLFFFHPLIFLNRVSFFLKAKLRVLRYKKVDIALIGGKSYEKYPGYQKAEHKIYCSSLDYGVYLKKKKRGFKNKKKFAVFIDAYLPFHPEHQETLNKFIEPEKYFRSLVKFLNTFQKTTKLEVIVAIYPKAELKKYSKDFKKFRLIENKVSELVKSCEVVLHHGSTAQSYAVIFNKPAIYLTTDDVEKHKYVRDGETRIEFMGSRVINIDDNNKSFFKNKKKIFQYNKKIYSNYLNNFLKHNLSDETPWFKNFNKYFNN